MPNNSHERTLEIHCRNCGAKFTAYYALRPRERGDGPGSECGICEGEAHKKGNLQRLPHQAHPGSHGERD